MRLKTVVFVLFLLFAAVYYIARVALFAANQTGGVEFERKVSELAEAVVSYSFLGIGVMACSFSRASSSTSRGAYGARRC